MSRFTDFTAVAGHDSRLAAIEAMHEPVHWEVWVDTGGTFTDCLARDPRGDLHRVKVLSSGCLRTTARPGAAVDAVLCELRMSLPRGFLVGCRLRRLAGPEPFRAQEIEIVEHDASTGRLRLARPLDPPLAGPTAVEVSFEEEAPLVAARLVTGTPRRDTLPPLAMRLATTRGTNALLERRGAATALFVNRGFADLLAIGTQQRPELFSLHPARPDPLPAAIVEVGGRLAADGAEIESLDLAELCPRIEELLADGIRVAAVALLHSYRNREHEERLAEFLGEQGFEHVSRSSTLAPRVRILPRAETAVVDAYLTPVVSRYLDAVRSAAPAGRLHVMTSAGGLVAAEAFRPKDGLLSGPAGGVVGAAAAARAAGHERILAFDMGGTSTDVCRVAGNPVYRFDTRIAGVRILAPALAIETVAAGGGSLCHFDGSQLKVGPESAGADPGPACYGAGGPLTLTDVNLLLGRLEPARFGLPLRTAAAEEALTALLDEVERHRGERPDRETVLEGLLRIADERMAEATRRISIRRGDDPADHALLAFGGAGGQHACALAGLLGIGTVLVPPDAGLLSALGLGAAVFERFAERDLLAPLAGAGERLAAVVAELTEQAREELLAEGCPRESITRRRVLAHLRLRGQETALAVAVDEPEDIERLAADFHRLYRERYGYAAEDRSVEIQSVRVALSTNPNLKRPASVPAAVEEPRRSSPPHRSAGGHRAAQAAWSAGRFRSESVRQRPARFRGAWRETDLVERASLEPGDRLRGPALILEDHCTTVVEPGWELAVHDTGTLVIRRTTNPAEATGGDDVPREPTKGRDAAGQRTTRRSEGSRTSEAVELELFTHRFEVLCEQMGDALQRTAVSVNVKERLDFSCALLDPDGELVANAPHIPVHLGALGLCVRRVAATLKLEPGDVAVTNHPAHGGSHLPDVTVLAPVFEREDGGALLGYVANRAHHAEIGGSRPGSMPPDARTLAEEGVVIEPTLLVHRGEARWEALRRRLETVPYPSRAVAENLADLAAATAAVHQGAAALRALAAAHGSDRVARFMRALTDEAERRMRRALARLPEGERRARQHLDDGTPLAVSIRHHGDGGLEIDFTGSGPVHPGNLNATPAVVRSCVLYVLRLLLDEPLPLNEGLLRPMTLTVPTGILDPPFPADPRRGPAVVGGNVETSQRLVDTLLQALELVACSQGTMNNVLFGNERFGYYETVAGGAGAGQGFAGASAVHTHMTNTAITDPELLEHRYPVRLERFAIRRGSGGRGHWPGGDGAVREIRFLAPMELSVLTQHRAEGPYGLAGGEPGAPGRQRLIRADGREEILAAVDARDVEPGDRLLLETPGGGGWGEPTT